MRTFRLILASLIVTTGCYGSVAGTPAEQNENGSSSEKSPSSSSSSEPAADRAKASQSAQSQATPCTEDAGACDQTEIASKVVVTIDGTTCTVKASGVGSGNGLDMGLDTHGWTYAIETEDCAGGFILNVSGVDNQAYPQTAPVTFLQTATLELFTSESDDGVDGGVGGTYLTVAGSSVAIESGPVNHEAKTIKGHGTIPEQGGTKSHTVTFEMDF